MPVSKQTSEGWFHCGRCGGVFLASVGASEFRRCGSCGKEPAFAGASVDVIPHVPAVLPTGTDERVIRGAELGRRRGKHRNRFKIAMMLVIWLIFLACLMLAGAYFWKGSGDLPVRATSAGKGVAESYDEKSVLKERIPVVYRTFVAHLIAATNEGRAQFVWNPIRVAPRIERFFQLNPFVRIDPQSMTLVSENLLELPEGQAIEATWTSQGRVYDTVFFQQNGEWRLDWEHFVRFSDYPLSLFLSGDGPDESEFRLYVRERLARERGDEPDMSLVFYSAMAGKTSEAGFQSPEFLVARDSVAGRRLAAAFREAREGRRPFGSRLEVEDPDGLLRVRVRIRRAEVEGERRFEIVDLPACHWYGVTDSVGVADGKEEVE